MRACFYSSTSNYNNNIYKINLVGHSMGGLVSRYYIENLNQDIYVDKLITICTPHWGSGYATASCFVGGELPLLTNSVHVICDHDLMPYSKMYGGEFSTDLLAWCNFNFDFTEYKLTEELNYSKNRLTKYYAIAAINYTKSNVYNKTSEIPTDIYTFDQLTEWFKNLSLNAINIKKDDDNMVGFLSQIGWTESGQDLPDKKINMDKIFVFVDSDWGNIPGIEMIIDMLHNKAPHKIPIMEKVYKYLIE